MPKIRVIHYLNQFFAGLGGEEKAAIGPQWFDGPRGPGQLLARESDDIEVVGTIAAGDNYMASNLEARAAEVVALIEAHLGAGASEVGKASAGQRGGTRQEVERQRETPQSAERRGGKGRDGEGRGGDDRPLLLVAGPAFNAGRYGMACAAVCKAVQARLGMPAVTALFEENPAVDTYRGDVTIVRAGENVMDMRAAIARVVRVGAKLVRGEGIVPAEDETLPRGLRQNYFASSTGAERAIEMLMRKLAGEPFTTEYVLPQFDRVPPAPAVPDLHKATVALVTSGGIVPRGNPDHIESASASRFGAYSIAGLDRLTAESHQSVHGGYDPTYANADPNRVLPLDALRALERSGRIGRLHDTYYATVGNATSVRRAVRFGEEIAAMLVNVGVHAVVVTST